MRSPKSSPRTKGLLEGMLRNENSNAEYNNIKTVFKRLKERKGNSANIAKRLLLCTVVRFASLHSEIIFWCIISYIKKAINDAKSMKDV